jgi:CBS-domain-containing membrane protein
METTLRLSSEQIETFLRHLHHRAMIRAENTLKTSIVMAWEHFAPDEQAARERTILRDRQAYDTTIKKADGNLQQRLADHAARMGR